MEYEAFYTSKGHVLDGALVFTPNIIFDTRGYFYESWNELEFRTALSSTGFPREDITFVQDNISHSFKNVLRGLHYQVAPKAQAKLIRCIEGEIFDVIVDLRKDSETYLQYGSATLSSVSHRQLWVPEGCAHGFLVISDKCTVLYKTTEHYSKEHERCLHYSDPIVDVRWPETKNLVVSEKDEVGEFIDMSVKPDLWLV